VVNEFHSKKILLHLYCDFFTSEVKTKAVLFEDKNRSDQSHGKRKIRSLPGVS